MTGVEPIPPGAAPRRAAVSGRVVLAGILAAGALAHAAFVARTAFTIDGETWFSLFDDAMISMQYARNLAQGHGLVWNAGEAPVEGYTNLLWTLWMALLHLLPVPESRLSLLVMLSGALLLLANAWVVRAIADELAGDDPLPGLLAAAMAALCYPLAYWTLRGMEVGALALLVDLALLHALRLGRAFSRRGLAQVALALCLAVLTRPDAVVPAAIVAGFSVLASPRAARWRAAWTVGGALIAVLAAHTALRLAYYGDPLPNTYYLKLTGVALSTRVARGLGGLRDVTWWYLYPLLVPAALLFAGGARLRRVGAGAVLLAAVIAGQAAYSVYVGGDAWEWMPYPNRYLCVALPALIVLCAVSLPRLASVVAVSLPHGVVRGRAAGAVALLLCALVAALANFRAVAGWAKDNALQMRDDTEMARRGVDIRKVAGERVVVAAVWAGALPYFSHRRAVDLFGKSDRRVARLAPVAPFFPGHDKWDLSYSVGALRPDLVYLDYLDKYPAVAAQMRQLGYEKPDADLDLWIRRVR